MKKLTLEDLKKIKEKAQADLDTRSVEGKDRIVVHMGTCGIAAGARETLLAILDEIEKRNLRNVVVTQAGCIGLCEYEPLISVQKVGGPKVLYKHVDPDKARNIIAQHVVNGQIVSEDVLSTE
ncbi:MAG TPA: (2Fe-2S) ferredoxin domain-containing protein [Dictyoglomaceae bacterium]|nr:(2Fe-2S) ferredoxin domain-containing protein [Dictyoglomaceae bacterium]HOL39525.1 (2Fe-2S) ferredoxin domain-containing protein [Dictyoglomaceae bacterium]HOP94682.1 (2Fe-2S) ferredoxin domain-containing protein [Dictyoglomaceae bacterium]HPP16096.1 (2Fe-2S) ferredoxin domain-containing protein [Dictyoglomaceae bacterium]HPU43031.1 (2Fe-2S) ferredoxin domain-containing protein [Dictyoglomaceae bacterium]